MRLVARFEYKASDSDHYTGDGAEELLKKGTCEKAALTPAGSTGKIAGESEYCR